MDDLVKRLRDYEERPFYFGDVDQDDLIAAADLLEAQAALIAEARELMMTIDRPLLQQGSWSEVRERARAALAKLDNA